MTEGIGARWLAMSEEEREERRSRATLNPDNPAAFELTVRILRAHKQRMAEEAS